MTTLAELLVMHSPVLQHAADGSVVLVGCACDEPLPLHRPYASGPDWTNFALHLADAIGKHGRATGYGNCEEDA